MERYESQEGERESRHGWVRLAIGSGIAFCLLNLLSMFAMPNPGTNPSPSQITVFMVKHQHEAVTSFLFGALAMTALILFVAALGAILRGTDRGQGVATRVTHVCGIAAAILLLAANAASIASTIEATRGAGTGIVDGMFTLGLTAFSLGGIPLGIALVLASLAMLRGRIVSPWIPVVGAILGLLEIVQVISVYTPGNSQVGGEVLPLIVLVGIWALATSVSLGLRARAAREPASQVAAA